MKVILVLAGILIGHLFLKDNKSANKALGAAVFSVILPYVLLVEMSSMDIREWPIFVYGSLFVFILFYLGKAWTKSKDKAALLGTAEGGTMGFVLYNLIGTSPLSHFFLIDQLGNGAALFSFIYWQVGHEYKLKSFFKNPLMVAMGLGLIANIVDLHFLKYGILNSVEPALGTTLTFLISVIVGTGIILKVSKDIFYSGFFWKFWVIRMVGAAASFVFGAPLALTVLFVLPPSFLLPVIYSSGQEEKKVYASNFIAASLPIALALSIALYLLAR